jgi:hypothetical protein
MLILAFRALLFLMCLAAITWGGRYERSAAALYAIAAWASHQLKDPLPHRFSGVQSGVLLVDLALLAGLGVIALRSDLWWPQFSASLQLLTTLAHVAKWMEPNGIWRLAYYWMAQASSFPSLIILAFGIFFHRKRRVERRNAGPP